LEALYTVCLQQHKSLMTFKALLFKCYARRGPIGAQEVRSRRPACPWTICSHSGTWIYKQLFKETNC